MNRRRFGALAAGAALVRNGDASMGGAETLPLSANGWMPNNAVLPVLLYRTVPGLEGSEAAAKMEALFTRNGWPPQWRNGVYDFHHFHSTTHEVLGFAAGDAELMLGGEGGHRLSVRAGDVALLPVGTGHCRVRASSDFLVIGAYPPGQHWDICRSAPDTAAKQRMQSARFPASDPVYGNAGPMTKLWKRV